MLTTQVIEIGKRFTTTSTHKTPRLNDFVYITSNEQTYKSSHHILHKYSLLTPLFEHIIKKFDLNYKKFFIR